MDSTYSVTQDKDTSFVNNHPFQIGPINFNRNNCDLIFNLADSSLKGIDR